MGAVGNMVKGFIFAAIYAVITIVVPLIMFSLIESFDLGFAELDFTREDYERVRFWIISIGLIITGCAFFSHSSPKQSIRKASIALVQVLVNCIYIWAYKFSGALELTFIVEDFAFITLDVSQMVLVTLGVYFLTIVLKVYDIIDFTINREKIREERIKD
ncbi:MAG: hypothetical protein ACFFC3_06110 [Candidatus Odinarchaeota archaeon]